MGASQKTVEQKEMNLTEATQLMAGLASALEHLLDVLCYDDAPAEVHQAEHMLRVYRRKLDEDEDA